ncbi:MAG: mannitol dehydrogenase family protein [Pseudomonadota bacterium]
MRLNAAALLGYHGPAKLPHYDRARVTVGILHLGIGSFHRAHQAVTLNDLLDETPGWGIRGISLRRPDMAAALNPQDGLYTLGIRAPDGLQARIIGSVLSVETGEQAAVAHLADPAIRLVTITVTEKGYAPDGPLARVLGKGLAQRAAHRAGPVTVLSCDNLTENGVHTGDLIRQAAPPDLRGWLDDQLATPSSMVDRITPATTRADRDEIAALTDLEDAWPVMTEPFSQWVIEDRFATDRPNFESAGVQMVGDVAPFEAMKLRLLNGAHTTLALLGPMLGHRTVAEAVADPDLAALISRTARSEVFPTLTLPETQLDRYWQDLLVRFSNPALHHALAQIAADSSQKLPMRLVAPWLERSDRGARAPGLCLAVAGWLATIRQARAPLSDPRDAELRRLAGSAPEHMIAALAGQGAPLESLQDRQNLHRDLARALEKLEHIGPRAAIRELLETAPS